MAKKLTVMPVMELSGSQLQLMLYPGKILALYSDNVAGQPYMVCLVDSTYRHNLPVVINRSIYAALLGGDIAPGTELTTAQYERLVEGLHAAQERDEVGQLLQNVLTQQH